MQLLPWQSWIEYIWEDNTKNYLNALLKRLDTGF